MTKDGVLGGSETRQWLTPFFIDLVGFYLKGLVIALSRMSKYKTIK